MAIKMNLDAALVLHIRLQRICLVAVMAMFGLVTLTLIHLSAYKRIDDGITNRRYRDDHHVIHLAAAVVEKVKDAYLKLQNNSNQKKTNMGASGCDLLEMDTDTNRQRWDTRLP